MKKKFTFFLILTILSCSKKENTEPKPTPVDEIQEFYDFLSGGSSRAWKHYSTSTNGNSPQIMDICDHGYKLTYTSSTMDGTSTNPNDPAGSTGQNCLYYKPDTHKTYTITKNSNGEFYINYTPGMSLKIQKFSDHFEQYSYNYQGPGNTYQSITYFYYPF